MSGNQTAPRGAEDRNALREGLGALFHAALRQAVITSGAHGGTLCLDDDRTGVLGLPGQHLRFHKGSSFSLRAEGFPGNCAACMLRQRGYSRCSPLPEQGLALRGGVLPCRSNVAITLGWAPEGTVGVLTLELRSPRQIDQNPTPICTIAARRIGRQLRRFAIAQRWPEAWSGGLLMAGTAESFDLVDDFIERASEVRLPALIHGEFGVETGFIAAALHFGGSAWKSPFVRIDCRRPGLDRFQRRLPEWFHQAAGGTLFLDGVDDLPWEAQLPLSSFLEAEVGIRQARKHPPAIRLVASCRRPLVSMIEAGTFHPALHAQLEWLSIAVPPLRQRRADIPMLLTYFLHKCGRPELRLSSQTLGLLMGYRWPGNIAELERTVVRLATMVEGELVRREHLKRYVPKIGMAQALNEIEAGRIPQLSSALGSGPSPPSSMVLMDELLEGSFDSIATFHPGLRKALRYIVEHGADPLTLRQLAYHACLSPSHLSQLFRKTLGVSFKPFLTSYRVERARQLLQKDPHIPISDAANAAGFGDLSQLERAFKPRVGCTPRAYRRSQRR